MLDPDRTVWTSSAAAKRLRTSKERLCFYVPEGSRLYQMGQGWFTLIIENSAALSFFFFPRLDAQVKL